MAKAKLALVTKYQWQLLQNSPVANSRTDDIWFFDELTGWLINSSGYVCKTEDGGANWTPKFFLAPNLPSFPYLRCMSWANRQIGWFGAVTGIADVDSITSPSQFIRTLLHQTTDGGETWKPIENLPEGSPAGICGFHAVRRLHLPNVHSRRKGSQPVDRVTGRVLIDKPKAPKKYECNYISDEKEQRDGQLYKNECVD